MDRWTNQSYAVLADTYGNILYHTKQSISRLELEGRRGIHYSGGNGIILVRGCWIGGKLDTFHSSVSLAPGDTLTIYTKDAIAQAEDKRRADEAYLRAYRLRATQEDLWQPEYCEHCGSLLDEQY